MRWNLAIALSFASAAHAQESCAPTVEVTQLRPGTVLELKRPIAIPKQAYIEPLGSPRKYQAFMRGGVAHAATEYFNSSTKLLFKPKTTKTRPNGDEEIGPFRCVLKEVPESEAEYLHRTTGAGGPSLLASSSSTLFFFEDSPNCPLSELVARRANVNSDLTHTPTTLKMLRDNLGTVAENAAFQISPICLNKEEKAALRKQKKELEEAAIRKKHQAAPDPEPDVIGYPCGQDESIRNLNAGSVIQLKYPLFLDEDYKQESMAYAGVFRLGASFRGGKLLTRDGTNGRHLEFDMPIEKAKKTGTRYEVPAFRCVLESKPISTSAYYERAGFTGVGDPGDTIFNFKKSPDCPVEQFTMKRSSYDPRNNATDYASLLYNMGSYFEVKATCGIPSPSPAPASGKIESDPRQTSLFQGTEKRLPTDATGVHNFILPLQSPGNLRSGSGK